MAVKKNTWLNRNISKLSKTTIDGATDKASSVIARLSGSIKPVKVETTNAIEPKTMLLIGGAVLAFLIFKK